jgi:lipoate-protein ligase A
MSSLSGNSLGPRDEVWDFWRDSLHSPAFNMAADEVLLEHSRRRGRPLLRFYGWDRLAVSIGYVQALSAAPPGYAAVRRPTGGGVVYHDHDFTYTVVFPKGHWLTGLDRMLSYDWLNRSVQKALQSLSLPVDLAKQEISSEVDRLSMVCFTNPTKYDVLFGDKKVAGSAQRRCKDGILHQGSLHFGGPLPVTREKLGEAMLQGLRSIMKVKTESFEPTSELLEEIELRCRQKYATTEWNSRR